jgi:hypothetical protein
MRQVIEEVSNEWEGVRNTYRASLLGGEDAQ